MAIQLQNSNYQSIERLYVLYKTMMEEFKHTPMSQRILFMGITFYLLYLLFKWIGSKITQMRTFYGGDFQQYTTLRSDTSNMPNSGLKFDPSTDVIHSSLVKETNLGYATYSCFLYVCSTNYSQPIPEKDINKPMVVFARGSPTGPNDPKNYPFIKCTPYVYLDSNTNSVQVVYSDMEHPAGICMTIPSIELDQWFHIAIVIENAKTVTVYHNGKVIQNANIEGISVTDANTLDLYMHPITEYSRGFDGSIGFFLHHNGAYTPKEIERIYQDQSIKIQEWERMNILEKEKVIHSPQTIRK